ncbi:Peptidyl-Lys metalloendopeptidase [Mycena indigotica]|uniref:Peptidyl-Lys metalloendopeptidase n=1 Tax=Mycena indigotica TaxID=2126181 RepID=A0A8H6SH62_9AGAR|nr:Peptidyl-Lys metalloendopeptidase [Mycena indigotica]KAF7298725.1 Peptidyl-Lys metalloendopeptidase [Mycena indigotica]
MLAALSATLIALSFATGRAAQVGLDLALTYSAEGPLHLVSSIINTGDVEIKLLLDPHTVLVSSNVNKFSISTPDGKSPGSIGVRMDYDPEAVLAENRADSFVTMRPATFIDIKHDVSKIYNFTETGTGKYTIVAPNVFSYVDAAGTVATIEANNKFATAHIELKPEDLPTATPPRSPAGTCHAQTRLTKRLNYLCCSPEQQVIIQRAALAAQASVESAHNYLLDLIANPRATPRWTTWFGAQTQDRLARVAGLIARMKNNNFGEYVFDCSCDQQDAHAYVWTNEPYLIMYLCPRFFDAPLHGRRSQVGTLVYEASHFNFIGPTRTIVTGSALAMDLARHGPHNAVFNADNYAYFVDNAYPEELP